MKLHELIKLKTKSKKRLGRGVSSGKGKTSGRGTKGQKARDNISIGFTGAGLPLYRKLPLKRGLGNRPVSVKPKPLALSKLNIFKKGSIVDLDQLLMNKLISKEDLKTGVKVLGEGLNVSLTLKLPASTKAKAAIEKAGGKVEYV
ncbi:50S ribosomal protein L15 [Candidatus Daviesbacteria bacterium RIFCSPHIGHO2_02_FULL_39_12]|uniref:Large ribosomal subunit protein uL15 n=2 Tax=Candidatus Daviesiibacteriota TaxID=1752718 RepID=A0A1F5J9Q9_9BACT|nr:MAG: 50S ribosomal protein L15 [Candidatus Daviesbacteria bacterium RIFCSPHIGHO2_02_FULL_39_12]OGE72610.1 MAG: 50S ribosomal protein L15 [Candidatus Daviesbacteria bacterium RIFCSPLOWO2_02_FULL_38_15]